MSVKLTDAQLVMMSAAAQRDDRCMAPDTMKGAALTKVSDKLIKLGFVREIRAKAGMPVRRRDDAGQGHALKLTAAGLKAVAVDEAPEQAVPIEAPRPRSLSEPSIVSEPDNVGEHAKTLTPRAGSKQAPVIDLLQRSEGATILDLIESTGWLPHTTRAALTGLPKRGYAVVHERIGTKESVYRIAGRAADGGDRRGFEPGASEDHDRELKPKASQAA